MAMKVEGGRMVPLSRDVVARRDWLRNREFRLQEALKLGKVDEALGWVLDIQGSAKPGDVNPEKIGAVVKALREAKSLISMAANSAQRIVTK
jgi:DNA-binding transcriptional regulator LsrR (DeoR family)